MSLLTHVLNVSDVSDVSSQNLNDVKPGSDVITTLLAVPRFELSSLPHACVVGIVGPRGTGKTVFTNWLLHERSKHWSFGIGCAPVKEVRDWIQVRMGNCNVVDKWSHGLYKSA